MSEYIKEALQAFNEIMAHIAKRQKNYEYKENTNKFYIDCVMLKQNDNNWSVNSLHVMLNYICILSEILKDHFDDLPKDVQQLFMFKFEAKNKYQICYHLEALERHFQELFTEKWSKKKDAHVKWYDPDVTTLIEKY